MGPKEPSCKADLSSQICSSPQTSSTFAHCNATSNLSVNTPPSDQLSLSKVSPLHLSSAPPSTASSLSPSTPPSSSTASHGASSSLTHSPATPPSLTPSPVPLFSPTPSPGPPSSLTPSPVPPSPIVPSPVSPYSVTLSLPQSQALTSELPESDHNSTSENLSRNSKLLPEIVASKEARFKPHLTITVPSNEDLRSVKVSCSFQLN